MCWRRFGGKHFADGAELSVPVCQIFGCGYIDNEHARIKKLYEGDGKLFILNHTTGEMEDLGGVFLGERQKEMLCDQGLNRPSGPAD